MTKTTSITIIVTLLILLLTSSVSALNFTLEWNGSEYASSGTLTGNFSLQESSFWDNITWEGNEPENTNIKFRARTASTEAGLAIASWSSYIETSGTALNVANNQWIEVEAHLSTTDTSVTPILYNFTINYAENFEPTYTYFTSPDTTNFSEETNLTDVKSMTLAIEDKGKIKFADDYGINAEKENYDTNIVIEDGSISINTSALDSTFNSSATLTFYNIDCGSPLVYYSDTATTRYNILAEDNQCLAPRCTNIQCVDSILTVDVLHFSGYAVSGSVNLSIDADDPKFVLEDVTFTAVYMNLTGGFINGATCNISFVDGSYIMDEQADHYNYTKAFAAAQTVDYNVTCSKTGYNTVFANDTAIINEIPVPEFSLLTLGIGLIAVLIGLLLIRRRKR